MSRDGSYVKKLKQVYKNIKVS